VLSNLDLFELLVGHFDSGLIFVRASSIGLLARPSAAASPPRTGPIAVAATTRIPTSSSRRVGPAPVHPVEFYAHAVERVGRDGPVFGEQTQRRVALLLLVENLQRLRQAACWLSLISPKYSTCFCATFPELSRRLSTTV